MPLAAAGLLLCRARHPSREDLLVSCPWAGHLVVAKRRRRHGASPRVTLWGVTRRERSMGS